MPIVISCPNPSCGKRYSVPDDAVGRSATCAACGTKIQITASPLTPKPPPPPPPPPSRVQDEDEPPRRRPRDDDDERDEPAPPVRRRRRQPASSGSFADFALFRWLLTPRVLVLLYWIVVILLILVGMLTMVSGLLGGGQARNIFAGVLGGLALIVLGPFVYRILFESMIITFRIHDTLTEIRDNTSNRREP